jgi:hypothetical protein
MRIAFSSSVALLFLVLTTTVFAKNVTVGIYAVIDQVTFEPEGSSANLIRISGVFVVPFPMSSGNYKAPQRGYLCFRIRPGMEEATRKDWTELKAMAGTGQVVGFAQYWVPNPRDPFGNPHRSLEAKVHTGNEAASPDVYPLPNLKGIVKRRDKDDPAFDAIAAQLQEASHR